MRLYLIKIFLLISLTLVLTRLFYWQIIKGDELSAKAEGQRFESRKIPGIRGKIVTSDGFILATSKPSYSLFAQPKIIKTEEKSKIAQTLAKILFQREKGEKEKLQEKLSQNLYWIQLERNISLEQKIEIEELGFTGLGFNEKSTRSYPESSSSAHILGFVAADPKGEDTGYFGLEGFYNGELKGVEGIFRQEKDALGLPILIGEAITSKSRNGKNLSLNIDRSIQFIVEEVLKKGMEKYEAKGAMAIVADPKTGAILALASYPNYDPENFGSFPEQYYKNPTVASSYEPGSTFKILIMSAALNEAVVEPQMECNICSGPVLVSGHTIRTWNNKYYPNSKMTDVIIHSDNVGMVFIAKLLGVDKLYEYLEAFGIGRPTGVDLQDELSLALRPKDSWREIDLATAAFGQGVAITPMQMIKAVGAIANGGKLMNPQIVKSIGDDTKRFEIKPKFERQVISGETAKKVSEMMVKAVEEGESKFAKPKGFKIAGKTGTAQIPVAGHYDPNKTIASFVGFAPADDPKFVILVRYDEPTSSPFGSETAAPTFFEIAEKLFTYFKIAPSEDN